MSDNPETSHNNSQKRVSIQEQPTTTEKAPVKAKSPKAIALACVTGHASSLHPQVNKIITTYGEKYITTYAKITHKQEQYDRLVNNHEFIPRSARINFEFYVRPDVKESDEFRELQDDATKLIEDFQMNLKFKITRSVQLDINYLHNDLNKVICEFIHHSVKTFHLLNDPSQTNPQISQTVAYIINNFGDNLLKHCRLDKTTFKKLYSEIFNDTIIESCTFTQFSNRDNPRNPYANNSSQATQNSDNVLPSQLNNISPFIDSLRNTLEIILGQSLDNFNNQQYANKVSTKLEAYSTEVLSEKATVETIERMDTATSVTPQELQELVKKSTEAAVSPLQKEIQSLKSKLATKDKQKGKNSRQGGPTGASSKNKSKPNNKKQHNTKGYESSTKNSQHHTNRSRRPRSREKRNRDSARDNKNSSRSRSNANSNRKKTRSRSRTRR